MKKIMSNCEYCKQELRATAEEVQGCCNKCFTLYLDWAKTFLTIRSEMLKAIENFWTGTK